MKLDFEEIILTGLKKAEFGEEKKIELYFLNQTRPNGSHFVNFVFFVAILYLDVDVDLDFGPILFGLFYGLKRYVFFGLMF